ncbi:hypothetical protein QJS10_CPA03g01301 [Acorus calamus]|uniref:Reverse transcriptase zinc-binding domain-containing protein n=1 Tax=Acorus calamus TaxID=4465 RepID=A0AAV9F396_ACOCL|nr:hypothetical protein QJS10_CPA03g01301 [Acorus calamus]
MEAAILDYKLSDIIEEGRWKVEVISNLLPPFWTDQILHTEPPECTEDGVAKWCWEGSTACFPKAADIYQILQPSRITSDGKVWKWMWKLPIIPKIKMFIWRLLWNSLHTKTFLDSRGIHVNMQCPLCQQCPGTAHHLFMECMYTEEVWLYVPNLLHPPQDILRADSWTDVFRQERWMRVKNGMRQVVVFVCICWQIWKARNSRVFRGTQTNAQVTTNRAIAMAWECIQCLAKKGEVNIESTWKMQPLLQQHQHQWRIELQREDKNFVVTDASVDLELRAVGAGCMNKMWSTPARVKMEGVNLGISRAWQMGLKNLYVCSDAESIIKLLNEKNLGPPQLQDLLSRIQRYEMEVDPIHFCKVSREGVAP